MRSIDFLFRPYGSCFVSSVANNTRAARLGLTVGDRLLAVDGAGLLGVTHREAAHLFSQINHRVDLIVQRIEQEQWRELCRQGRDITKQPAVCIMTQETWP